MRGFVQGSASHRKRNDRYGLQSHIAPRRFIGIASAFSFRLVGVPMRGPKRALAGPPWGLWL